MSKEAEHINNILKLPDEYITFYIKTLKRDIRELKEQKEILQKYIVEYKDNIIEYCKEIEEKNKEMLEYLIKSYKHEGARPDALKNLIEKNTGRSIEEILNG